MKIICLIDSLNSGGSQLQMVNLACGLKERGHHVEFLVYHPKLIFFREQLSSVSIYLHMLEKEKIGYLKVLWKVCSIYRNGNFDGVISFLDGPNALALIAKLLIFSRVKVVVSERRNYLSDSPSTKLFVLRLIYFFAHKVVANSTSHGNWLRSRAWLRNKTLVIPNGYNTEKMPTYINPKHSSMRVRLLVVARINPVKNAFRLMLALIEFCKNGGGDISISWAGRQEQDTNSLQERRALDQLLMHNPQIADQWNWLDERKDIPGLLEDCDALVHVSLCEGQSNAICEAFWAGRPVIASNVCDHPILVEDGVRGLLCDPLSSKSICSALNRFASMSHNERRNLGLNARIYAEKNLTLSRMVSNYEALLK